MLPKLDPGWQVQQDLSEFIDRLNNQIALIHKIFADIAAATENAMIALRPVLDLWKEYFPAKRVKRVRTSRIIRHAKAGRGIRAHKTTDVEPPCQPIEN